MVSDSNFSQTYRGSFVLLVLAAFVIVCAGMKLAAPVLVPLVLGGFIAMIDVPFVLWLYRRRMPLPLTVMLALIVNAVLLAGFSSLLVSSAASLFESLPIYVARLQEAERHASVLLLSFGVQVSLFQFVEPAAIVATMASLAADVASAVANLLLALIIASFLLLRFARLGAAQSAGALFFRTGPVRRAVREMHQYIAIKTLTSVVTGVALGFWLWLLDADLPILFGVLTFLLNFIPTLGSIVAGVLATSVGLLQHDLQHASLIALGYVVVNVIIGNIIEPRFMGRALGLWPLVVLLSVVFWGWMFGIIGAVLSAFLTQGVKLLFLATPDLRPLALSLGPQPKARAGAGAEGAADLLEEAMPKSTARR